MTPVVADGRMSLAAVNVVVGHYGVGKTTVALNLALDAASAGCEVTLVDLDVVNPYFRSTEYRPLLEAHGVRLVAPVFAEEGSALDVPSLTGGVIPAIEGAYEDSFDDGPRDDAAAEGRPARRVVIVDAGGDDVGAAVLGRFAQAIAAGEHAVLFVLNPLRNITQRAEDAVGILREVEDRARLRATALVSNAHLKDETDVAVIERGIASAQAVSEATGLPLACATVPKPLLRREKEALSILEARANLYPVMIYVKMPWE